jgi:curved DNA-binding protein CbpA
MNGQLSEHPLVELIRECSDKKLSGKLQLQNDKVIVVIYFQSGKLAYAACNVKTFRLSEYLIKLNVITADEVANSTKDQELLKTLTHDKRLSETQAEQLQSRQITDLLRLPLLWTEGRWEFDNRSHLKEDIKFTLDISTLLIETARRLPETFTSSRFRNPSETFSPAPAPPNVNLSTNEVYILSRIDQPTSLNELLSLSGLPPAQTLHLIYSLAIVDAIKRESWKSAFRDVAVDEPPKTRVAEPVPEVTPTPPTDSVELFLDRISRAESHYQVLDIDPQSPMSDLKSAYYDIARRHHPDRYRTGETSILRRVEAAFARITQAYDTLRDPGQRATYDSKLEAQRRAAKLAQAAPKATSDDTSPQQEVVKPAQQTQMDPIEEAEVHFKEGFAALELGQRNVALGLLAAAAKAVPTEARYRAYYGRALAHSERTRRLAEAELQTAIKLQPQNADYRVMLAELYRDLGFNLRARGEAERAIAADSNNRKARELLKSLTN